MMKILSLKMFGVRRGEISMEYVVAAVLLLILLVIVLIYTGVLKVEMKDLVQRFIEFLVGGE